MQRILVVEDELKIGRLIRDYLENAGFEVTVVADGHSALSHTRQHRPDLVVLDLASLGSTGSTSHGRYAERTKHQSSC